MKKFTANQIKLINLLGDGKCHNGNQLGDALGVTRAAIWKKIKQLTELGLQVTSVARQGYQLDVPLQLLNENVISQAVETYDDWTQTLRVHLFASIDSTNHFLKALPSAPGVDVCCAETQTQGRGRFGRHWHSPFGENIYCSSRWHFDCDITRLSGLSLVVSLAITTVLTEFISKEFLRIKWPNDIFWKDKKICGSLIEISAESHGTAEVIIGIGLNVNANNRKELWGSLHDVSGHSFDRNVLIARLVRSLNGYLQQFIHKGFSSFINEWNRSDYLRGKEITIQQPAGKITGQADGVDQHGQLILVKDGRKIYLSSGDASLGSG